MIHQKVPHFLSRIVDSCVDVRVVRHAFEPDNSLGLLVGQAGLGVFMSEVAQLDNSSVLDKVSREYFSGVVEKIPEHFLARSLPDLSLASGLSGVALALSIASREQTRYQNVLSQLDRYMFPWIHRYISYSRNHAMNVKLYDIIYGLSGMLLYTVSRSSSEAFAISAMIMDYLSDSAEAGLSPMQGYAIKNDQQPSARHARLYPLPTVDLGMAHGVSGIIASLSIALIAYPQLKEKYATTLHRLVEELLAKRIDSNSAWPSHWTPQVDLAEHVPSRLAWCYGLPGIASALRLASQALEMPIYRQQAISMLLKVQTDGIADVTFETPILCHGSAGFLQIVQRFDEPVLLPLEQQLYKNTTSHYDSLAEYGFWSEQYPDSHSRSSAPLLLEGAAGVCLALIHTELQNTIWDRSLALS